MSLLLSTEVGCREKDKGRPRGIFVRNAKYKYQNSCIVVFTMYPEYDRDHKQRPVDDINLSRPNKEN